MKLSIYEYKHTSVLHFLNVCCLNRFHLDPETLGVSRCAIADLKGGDATYNASELRAVLGARRDDDHDGLAPNAKRDAVILNAGVGLYVYGGAGSILEGVNEVRKVLDGGKALETLDRWIESSSALYKAGGGEGSGVTSAVPSLSS